MYAKLYLFLLVSFLCATFAQKVETVKSAVPDTTFQTNNIGEAVNIDSLVSAQVAIARAKKWENHEAPEIQISAMPAVGKIESAKNTNWFLQYTSMVGADEATAIKGAVIFFAALFVFLVVFIRRMFLNRKKKKNDLRSNIQLLRSEKSMSKKGTKLKVIRKNLLNNSVNLNSSEGSLTRRAKELKIAKGEIILAAKIKSYELSVCSNER
jgi:membrane protein implicated in regulation of membrane protease activity